MPAHGYPMTNASMIRRDADNYQAPSSSRLLVLWNSVISIPDPKATTKMDRGTSRQPDLVGPGPSGPLDLENRTGIGSGPNMAPNTRQEDGSVVSMATGTLNPAADPDVRR